MNLHQFNNLTHTFGKTEAMPVLFLGHGSPMNAIEENRFAQGWRTLGASIPKPNAILCISAHWLTRGTFVTAMEKPRTIHDFGGFPQALFDVQYPVAGSLALAQETKEAITSTPIGFDHDWGLDHGSWGVLNHLYPEADIPVVEMSLDYTKPAEWHYNLAKELARLREKGVLILGSGNIVHNLRLINWQNPENGEDWAIEANEKVKSLIQNKDHQPLTRYQQLGTAVQMAIPTPDHYLPLLYTLGLQTDQEKATFINDETVYGSISMTSVKIDKA